jgi:hypothetical protein
LQTAKIYHKTIPHTMNPTKSPIEGKVKCFVRIIRPSWDGSVTSDEEG